MTETREIIYEQIGTSKDGIPQYGPYGSTHIEDENAIEAPPLWQGLLAFLGTAIAIAFAYPGA
jgi:hypothetical protein